MPEGTQRRLAAIVAADVVGYSRLMGADETGTLAVRRAHRYELIDPLLDRHGGRIVKSTGDGLLLEFPSVVAAVEFAIATEELGAKAYAELAEKFKDDAELNDDVVGTSAVAPREQIEHPKNSALKILKHLCQCICIHTWSWNMNTNPINCQHR